MSTILVVDDEEMICEVMLQLLRGAGYDVVVAYDGDQALKAFARQPVQLVITDILMPEREGLELIRDLRAKDSSLKVIAISGGIRLGGMDFLHLARKVGADRTFQKPVDNGHLLAAVRELIPQTPSPGQTSSSGMNPIA